MAKNALEVSYNARTYRWEVWRTGDPLPTCTNPSKEHAVLNALTLLRVQKRGRLLVYTEDGQPETVLYARDYRVADRPPRSESRAF